MSCTDVEQAVENQDCRSAVSLVEGDRSDAPVGPYDRIRLPDRVRTARRLGSTGLRLLELADDGETDCKAACLARAMYIFVASCSRSLPPARLKARSPVASASA